MRSSLQAMRTDALNSELPRRDRLRRRYQRTERVAVALEDLDRLDKQFKLNLLAGRLDLSTIVEPAKGVACVVFSCDIISAAIVADLIRSDDRKNARTPSAIYMERNTVWSAMKPDDVWTVVVNDLIHLNPLIFPAPSDILQLGFKTPPKQKFLPSFGAAKNKEEKPQGE